MAGQLSEGMLFDIGYVDGLVPALAVPERKSSRRSEGWMKVMEFKKSSEVSSESHRVRGDLSACHVQEDADRR